MPVTFPPYTNDRDEIMRRTTLTLGFPFIHLPGNPPEHKIVGEFQGVKIRVGSVEMVWNDWMCINQDQGVGAYEETLDHLPEQPHGLQRAIWKLAQKLYGDFEVTDEIRAVWKRRNAEELKKWSPPPGPEVIM